MGYMLSSSWRLGNRSSVLSINVVFQNIFLSNEMYKGFYIGHSKVLIP